MLKVRLISINILLFVVLLVGIIACENSTPKITVYQIENLDETPVGEATVNVGRSTFRVAGGSGSYNARSSNSDIATAWIANDYLHITAKKTGPVEVAIVDNVNETTTLKLNIQPHIKLFSVQDSHSEVEVEARSRDGKKAIGYIEKLIEGQLKTKGMYYKFVYDEMSAGRVVIYPRGLVDEFKIEGTFKSQVIDAKQTLFEVKVNGYVREYNLVETTDDANFALKKGLFVENYSNDFAFKNVKVLKALGVETVFYK